MSAHQPGHREGARRAARVLAGAAGAALVALAMVATLSDCGARHRRHTVVMRRVQFEPATLVVAAGDTVEWVNRDIVPHTATAAPPQAWGSPVLQPGDHWETVLATRGKEPYACQVHPSMRGELEVH